MASKTNIKMICERSLKLNKQNIWRGNETECADFWPNLAHQLLYSVQYLHHLYFVLFFEHNEVQYNS